jgi:hypothetical protein
MKKGIEVRLGPGDRERLEAVVGSGNSPQKHVWRARIVLLTRISHTGGVFGRQISAAGDRAGEERGGCEMNGLVSTFASLVRDSDP